MRQLIINVFVTAHHHARRRRLGTIYQESLEFFQAAYLHVAPEQQRTMILVRDRLHVQRPAAPLIDRHMLTRRDFVLQPDAPTGVVTFSQTTSARAAEQLRKDDAIVVQKLFEFRSVLVRISREPIGRKNCYVVLEEVTPNTVTLIIQVLAALGKVDRRFAFG